MCRCGVVQPLLESTVAVSENNADRANRFIRYCKIRFTVQIKISDEHRNRTDARCYVDARLENAVPIAEEYADGRTAFVLEIRRYQVQVAILIEITHGNGRYVTVTCHLVIRVGREGPVTLAEKHTDSSLGGPAVGGRNVRFAVMIKV